MNEVMNTILYRRSVRKYLPQQITDEERDMILTAAEYALCAGGRQSSVFVVCKDATLNCELGEINFDVLRSIADKRPPMEPSMLVSIPPHLSVSQFVGYLKGKSTLMIFDRHANLKNKYGSRHFWCRGYYVDTVGKNKKAIEEYIRNQLVEDEITDQMTMKEYMDPFTGSKNSKA